ncbi:MAG: YihY/virulence factor BrkB family protein [Marmoricola sp.]
MKDRIKHLLARVDRYQQQHRWLGIPFAVSKKFGEDQAGNLAALIAYYTFSSIFPLLLVLTTVLGFVLSSHPGARDAVLGSALDQFPIVGAQIGKQVHGLHGSVLALVIGIAGAIWGGLGAANAAQTAFNSVYEVPMVHRPNIVFRTLRSLLLLLVVVLAVVVSTVLNGISTGGSTYGLDVLGPGLRILAAVLALAANIAIFSLAFRVLTVKDVTFKEVLPGAVFAAICWQVLQLVGGYYVGHTLSGAGQTYGTFAVVIALLAWLYLESQLVLVAAELNTVLRMKLYPRGLVDPPETDADRRAYEAHAETQRFQEEESVDSDFSGSVPEQGRGPHDDAEQSTEQSIGRPSQRS